MLKTRLHPQEKETLEAIAKQHGYIYGGRGSTSQLLTAIANGIIDIEIKDIDVKDIDVKDGGKFVSYRIPDNTKQELDRLLHYLNVTYYDKPSYSSFLKAIATNQIKLKNNLLTP